MLTNNSDLFRALAATTLRAYLMVELAARHASLEAMNDEAELRRLQGEARLLRQFVERIEGAVKQSRA